MFFLVILEFFYYICGRINNNFTAMARLVNLSWIKVSTATTIAPPTSKRGIVKRIALLLLMAIFGSIHFTFAQTTTVNSVPVNNAPTSDTPGSVNVTLQGDGTSEHPLEIGSVNDWNAFATYVNSNTDHKTAQAIITADITFTNNYLQPNGFRGTLDGQGHTIILHQSDSQECGKFPNLSASSCWGGLFFKTYGNATIKNLRLAGEIKNNKYDCGTFVQNANGSTTIDNCQSSVEIIKTAGGNGNNGGMIGGNDDINSDITIRNSLVDGKFSVSGGNFSQNGNGGFMGRLNDSRKFLTVNNSYAHPAIDNSNYTNYTDFYPFCNTPDQSQGVATPTINYSYYKFPDGFENLVTTGTNQGTNRAATGNTTTIVSNLNTSATKVTINNEQVNPWIAHNDTVYLRTFAKYVDIKDFSYGQTPTITVVGNNGNGTVTYKYKVQGAADDTYATYEPGTTVLGVGSYTLKASVAAANGWNGWESTMDFEINADPFIQTKNDRIIVNNLPLHEPGTNVTLMGTGTNSRPFEIGTPDEWDAFATYVNTHQLINVYAKLTADITFTGNHQQPGENANYSFKHGGISLSYYNGTFDGQGHTITLNQQVKGGSDGNKSNWGGLFWHVRNATIKNLHVTGTIRVATSSSGGIVQNSYGQDGDNMITLENCKSSIKTISSDTYNGGKRGGLIGDQHNNSTITIRNCLFDGTFDPCVANEDACGFIGLHSAGSTVNTTIKNSYSQPVSIDGTYNSYYTFSNNTAHLNIDGQHSYYLLPSFSGTKIEQGVNVSEMTPIAIVEGLNTNATQVNGQDPWIVHNDTVYLKTFAKYVDIAGWEYGSAANTPTVFGNSGNATVTYKYKVQGADDNTYSETQPTNAGNYTVLAIVPSKDGWSKWTSTMDFSITAKPVTITGITASDKVYDGTTTATINSTATFTGKLENDELTLTATGVFSDKNVGTGKDVTVSDHALGGASAGNYTITSAEATTTANITPKTATLSWSATSFDYSGSAQAPTASVTNLEAGDDCGVTVSVTGDHSAVGSYTATASALSGTSSGNYVLPEANTQVYEIVRSMGITFTGTQHWNTYCAFEDLATPAGLTAYIITGVSGTTATASVIGYIPKDVGVLLYSASAGSGFKASAYTGTAGTFTSNKLVGITAATSLAAEAGYILYGDAFVLTTGGTLPANRCYLPASGPASSRGLNIDTGDGTTFINAISKDEMDDERWFDLQGQRIVRPQKKGVYIRNGKKVVIK